nr:transposase domain-containing protein [Prevotella sp. P5-50]
MLYTLALSAKMNHLNFFDYLTDILDRTAQWQPNVPLENYRNLLPDRWQPSTKE